MMSFEPDSFNILVVDDSSANLKTLTAILSERGYQVRPAINGEVALSAARKKQPDLILLDIRMPGMDGYDVCLRLKEDQKTRDIPVIFISALDEAVDRIKAFELGGVDYITKPFQPQEVLARMQVHLSLRQMQVRLEQQNTQLQQANAKLKELDRLKSTFLASMSHELRTPLNSIIGFTGIILQGMAGEVNEEQRKQLTMVKNSAKHLLNLIEDVLDISDIEAGRVELSLEEFGLNNVVSEVVKTLSPAANQKSLDLLTEVPEGITLFTDRKRIQQVLMNLVSNAVKFTNQGSVKIAARVPGDDNLEIRVIDTGAGIKNEDMNKLFQPFQRIGMSLTKSYTEGTGIGLYLTKKLADLLGGDISAKSIYSRGSEFTFTVPLRYEYGNRNAKYS